MSENKSKKELAKILTEKIFSIRSNKVVTIAVEDEYWQMPLPKFIKKDQLEATKAELLSYLEKAIEAPEAGVIIRIFDKEKTMLVGFGIVGGCCEYCSPEMLKKCCEEIAENELEENKDELMFCDFASVVASSRFSI